MPANPAPARAASDTDTTPYLCYGVVHLLNVLNKIRNNTTDPDLQKRIRGILTVLHAQLTEVIRQQIDNSKEDFKAAVKSLGEATEQAQDAVTDIKKVAKAIELAIKAVKAVDKIVGVVSAV